MSEQDSQAGSAAPAGAVPEPDRRGAGDADLQAGLGGLAAIITGSLGLADLLARVAGFARYAVPGVDGAGANLLRSDDGKWSIQAWGATADFVREIDRTQHEVLDEGPGAICLQTHRPVVSGSLGSDARWPRLGGRVARLGLHSGLTLPLVVDGQVIGVISCYARDRDMFGGHAVAVGQQFAAPAAVAVRNAQVFAATNAKAEQLQTALSSRAVIDQAIGIIRSRSGGSADEAFERLRTISQAENVKLAAVAQRLVDEAVRRAHARHSG